MLTERSQFDAHAAVAVVSLSNELYSYCSSLRSSVNGEQAITGEANTTLCMSYSVNSGGASGAHSVIHEACTALLQGSSPVLH